MSMQAFYTQRIGVQQREWVDLPKPIRITAPGEHIADPGPRAGRTLTRHRDMAFLTPKAGPLPRGSSWCSTTAELNMRISQAESWQRTVGIGGLGALSQIEQELAAKATLQRGGAFGWDTFNGGLGLPDGEPLDDAFTLIGDLLSSRFGHLTPEMSAIPRHTNSGAPSYGMSDADKALHTLMARSGATWSELLTTYKQIAGIMECIPTPHAITFSRTGPTAKLIDVADWDGANLAITSQARSVAPRRRVVFGVPSWVNISILPYANTVKYAVMRLPWCAHPNELSVYQDLDAAAHFNGQPHVALSDDISAFDLSVRRMHQEGLARHVYARFWPQAIVEIWLNAQKMPLLSGPLDSVSRGYLYHRERGGVTTSGIITTSLDGTLINLARVITAYARATGRTVRAAWEALLSREWYTKVWGDDTVIIAERNFSVKRYEEASSAIGFKATILDGVTFLMRHYDFYRHAVYPLATRVFQQTVWNERGGRAPEVELLGLYARTTGLEAHPLAREVWDLIKYGSSTLDAFRVTSRSDLKRILTDPGVRRQLEGALRANQATISDWLGRADRGHTEDSALLAWLTAAFGFGIIKDATFLPPTGITAADARRKAVQLATYLAQPTEERGAPPGWLTDLIATGLQTQIDQEPIDEETAHPAAEMSTTQGGD